MIPHDTILNDHYLSEDFHLLGIDKYRHRDDQAGSFLIQA